jgi:hypothetical protein
MARVLAAALAAMVGAASLALFAFGEARLDLAFLDLTGAVYTPTWVRVVLAVVAAVPWLVGAGLFALRRARLATAVVVTAALLLVPSLGPLLRGLEVLRDGALEPSSADGVAILGGVGVWVLGLLAGTTAWLSRPRGRWREQAPGAHHGYTAAAALAWLGATFANVAYAPPGAPRRFLELSPAGTDGAVAVLTYGTPIVVAAVLWGAPRLALGPASASLLTFVLPELLGIIDSVQLIVRDPVAIATPAGLLGVLGLIALLGYALVWALDAADAPLTAEGAAPSEASSPSED